MNIEELAFKNYYELKDTQKVDLLLIIDCLQKDRKQWINQYTQAHNDYVNLQQENQQLKEKIIGKQSSIKALKEALKERTDERDNHYDKERLYKSVIKEIREYINSNPNVSYDEYLIDVETLKNNECVDETVGEVKFISNLLQILDKGDK